MATLIAMQFIDIPKQIQYVLFGIECLYICYKIFSVIKSIISKNSLSSNLSNIITKIPEFVSLIKTSLDKIQSNEIPNEELNKINNILEEYKNAGNPNDSKSKQ